MKGEIKLTITEWKCEGVSTVELEAVIREHYYPGVKVEIWAGSPYLIDANNEVVHDSKEMLLEMAANFLGWRPQRVEVNYCGDYITFKAVKEKKIL